jgi:hypothetical protein
LTFIEKLLEAKIYLRGREGERKEGKKERSSLPGKYKMVIKL